MDLKTSREDAGLTQDALAQKSGIPKATISKIESGKRNTTIETLMSIASAMGKTVEVKLV